MGEWTEVALGDVLTLQRGFDLPKRSRRPGIYPVISSAGRTGFHDEFKVDAPGVVIGRYGSLGSVHWVEEPFWPLNTSLWVKDFKGNDARFVSYLLQTVTMDGSGASAVPGVNRNHLHKQLVRRPKVGTQQRIATVLSTFDELIEINERRIELLEDLAHSLYREWFVHFRFPGHKGQLLVNTEVGLIPKGWEVCELGDVATVNQAGFKNDELPDPFVYLDIATLGVGRMGNPPKVRAVDAPGRARRQVADGDVVWATVRPNRRGHAVVHNPPGNLVASTGLAVLSPTDVPSSFLFEYAASKFFCDYLAGQATGSAYPAVRPSDFRRAPVIMPPDDLLRQFDATVDRILRAGSCFDAQARQVAATRDLLLPCLVTGQLDVSGIDLGVLTPTAVV